MATRGFRRPTDPDRRSPQGQLLFFTGSDRTHRNSDRIAMWSTALCCLVLGGGILVTAGRGFTFYPSVVRRSTETVTGHVNKTFGPDQRCLKVAADGSAEAAAIVAALFRGAIARTIELDESGDSPSPCAAYVAIGRRPVAVRRYLKNFRNNAAERMLMLVAHDAIHIWTQVRHRCRR